LERGDRASARTLLDGLEDERPGTPEAGAAQRALAADEAADGTCVAKVDAPWHVDHGHKRRPLRLEVRPTPDWRYAVSAGGDGAARVWELATGKCIRVLKGSPTWASAVAISADARYAVSVFTNNEVRFWDVKEGRCLHEFTVPGKRSLYRVGSPSLSGDGQVVAAVVEQFVWVWDLPSRRVLRRFDPRMRTWPDQRDEESFTVRVTLDGKRALVTSNDSTPTQLWDLATGSRLQTLPDTGRVTAAWMDRGGRAAVIASHGHALRVWNLEDATCVRTVTTPTGEIGTVSVSEDLSYAVTGGEDDTVRVWSLATGRCLRTFKDHRDRVRAVLMNPDGRGALSLSQDNTVRAWE
ncbi:WD40 repeat domain-containing protein, partial [Streptomyces sp. NPDC054956]